MFPARREIAFFARGLLLVCGAFVLHTAEGVNGPTGMYVFWTLGVVLGYALLLPGGWAVLLAAFGLAELAVCAWLVATPGGLAATVAQAGLLVAFVPIGLMFGRAMHQADRQVELSLMDRRTRLYNEAGFLEHGAVLLDDCRRAKRPFSLVLLNADDLRDVPGLVGRKAGQKLFNQAVRGIASAIQGEGLAARTDSAVFALILPGLTAAKAQALVCQKLGTPPSVQLELPHGKVNIVLDMVVAEADASTRVLEDLYDSLQGRLREPRGGLLPTRTAGAGKRADAVPVRAASPTVPLPLAQPAA
jgi:GGDEF domain-containing protein